MSANRIPNGSTLERKYEIDENVHTTGIECVIERELERAPHEPIRIENNEFS